MSKQTLSATIKKSVFSRDGHKCRKCGANHGLHCHHIKAVMDGGGDELDNLITLCSVCHTEWHSLEMSVNSPETFFEEWLELPPLNRLMIAISYIDAPKAEGLSAREWLDTIKKVNLDTPRFQG